MGNTLILVQVLYFQNLTETSFHSLSSAYADHSSHHGGTAKLASSASADEYATWAQKTTLRTTSTAPSKRATAAGAPCSCHVAWSVAAAPSARPASGCLAWCFLPMARCIARWTAMVLFRWSEEPRYLTLLLVSCCLRWLNSLCKRFCMNWLRLGTWLTRFDSNWTYFALT